jgi:type I restriction enzyme M protein
VKRQIEKLSYERADFWATTSNKQLNFVQHVYSMLKDGGRAAVVVPDNVLFEGGAGELIRRELLKRCDVHTLLRLPTGIWYSPAVKANVLFLDKVKSGTKDIWVYDLRSNRNFSLKQNQITSNDLLDFINSYCADDRERRKEAANFRRFSQDQVLLRDQANLDLHWPREDSFDRKTPTPQSLVVEILRDLGEAMQAFAETDEELKRKL